MTKIQDLARLGQAVWIDYIRRSFMTSGALQRWIDQGLRGMTSNPTIFEKAIAHSSDYDEDLRRLAGLSRTPKEVFYEIAVADIQAACDLFRPVFDATQGEDGYVSIEVSPTLAHDSDGTLSEVLSLWRRIERPNLMVKIPATPEGLPAIMKATRAGVNVNITLIFGLERYAQVMQAYLDGLSQRVADGLPVKDIHSVASFFVSRVDTKVDQRLEEIIKRGRENVKAAEALRGKAAVANARLAYEQFLAVFEGQEFAALAREQHANLQRPLWASTSTKNPAYSDILYVQELIGANTVSTMPEETLQAFLDHGEVRKSIENDLNEAHRVFKELESLGISMRRVAQELEDEGVASFSKSFDSLLGSIAAKEEAMRAAPGPAPGPAPVLKSHGLNVEIQSVQIGDLEIFPGDFHLRFDQAVQRLEAEDVVSRLWQGDHTLWKPRSDEISNRLGWLDIAARLRRDLSPIETLLASTREEGYTQAVLLGMGGSSLAASLFAQVFTPADLPLTVLDSTDPAAVQAVADQIDPARTLFLVSTKSGSTEEILSFFRYFYNKTLNAVGSDLVGRHFVAITDPGSPLAGLAQKLGFRQVLLNDPNIGGHYSALSLFGLAPAALVGADVGRLLDRAAAMAQRCSPDTPIRQNPGAMLGALMGELANAGRNKIHLVLSPVLRGFGNWLELLIAESTGKEGRGILPVVGEPLLPPENYTGGRLFVYLQLAGESAAQAGLQALQDAGFPVVRVHLNDFYDLGGQFFLWEFATAVAGFFLGINPFDQPNVEASKQRARALVQEFTRKGRLPKQAPTLEADGVRVYWHPQPAAGERVPALSKAGVQVFGSDEPQETPTLNTPAEALRHLLAQAKPGGYVAFQAFLPPSQAAEAALRELRLNVSRRYHLATTVGFGPRFLHSTGQLHKGDGGQGVFVQLIAAPKEKLAIPAEAGRQSSSIDFGTLELAQALGDAQALVEAGRPVLRFYFTGDPVTGIRQLAGGVA